MTLKELAYKKECVDRTVERIDAAVDKTKGEFARMDGLEAATDANGKEAISIARASVNELAAELSECRKALRDYSTLLDAIMLNTDISWPPKCGIPE